MKNEIISPRPVTAKVERPSAQTMQECAEVRARQDRRNRAATIEIELLIEGHTSAEKINYVEAPQ